MYNERYYTSGNYVHYLKRKFDLLAHDLYQELELDGCTRIVDFGCGYGGLLNEFYGMGMSAIAGTDISNWAIEYGRRVFPHIAERLQYYNRNLLAQPTDCLLFLDVLEHMPECEAEECLELAARTLSGVLAARIPVSSSEGKAYVLDVSNNDPTHINCHCREWWLRTFENAGYEFKGDLETESIYSSEGVLSGIWRARKV